MADGKAACGSAADETGYWELTTRESMDILPEPQRFLHTLRDRVLLVHSSSGLQSREHRNEQDPTGMMTESD